MRYCPACQAEYRDGFARCADCDLELGDGPLPPPAPSPPPSRWVAIYAGDFSRAQVLRGSLEAAGIPTLLPDEHLQMLGWYALPIAGTARVLVPEEDLREAGELLRGVKDPEPPAPSLGVPDSLPPTSVETIPDAGSPPGPSPPEGVAGSNPVPLLTLARRSATDLCLAAALPLAMVSPIQYRIRSGDELLALLLLEPTLVGVFFWRRRAMLQAREAVMPVWKSPDPAAIPLGVLGGALLAGLAMVYLKLLFDLEREPLSPNPLPGHAILWKLLLIFNAVGMAPICEEFFFRGGILAAYAASGRSGWGLLTSSLLFSAAHLSLERAPLFFLDGLFLGGLFLGTRSLRVPIIAHATVNGILIGISLG